jgi:cytidylate kinase
MSSPAHVSDSAQPQRLPVVAIDGPAGAGKSTVARRVALRFGLLNLESGAMYRAFALKALRAKVAADDQAALVQLSTTTGITLEQGEDGNRVLLDGEDVTAALRDPEVSQAASKVSVYPPIRAWMVSLQQHLGEKGGVVMEGRDIGTVVFPNADVKIFLDADTEIRGRRRFDQMGSAPAMSTEEVIRDLRERDQRDRNRADSPLKPASDSVLLDSTYLTLEETVLAAERIVEEKLLRKS